MFRKFAVTLHGKLTNNLPIAMHMKTFVLENLLVRNQLYS
jgi:hypothetical protein